MAKRYPITGYADEYMSDFEKQARIIVRELQAAIDKGIDPDISLKKIFVQHDINGKLTESFGTSIAKSAGFAVGLKLDKVAFSRWYLENAYSVDGVKLSSKVSKLADRGRILGNVRESMRANESLSMAAQRLHDTGMIGGDIARDVKRTLAAARASFGASQDTQGYLKYRNELLRTQRRVDRLVDPSTSKLKRAYQTVLDITEEATEAQIERAVKYAVYFKERYNSERIVRSESARAYNQAWHTAAFYDDDIVGYRSVLSTAHTEYDICDWWATADLYGLGPGVYPKENGPDIPHHPNCRCIAEPVIAGEIDTAGKKELSDKLAIKQIDSLSEEQKITLMGKAKAERYDENKKSWRSLIKSYADPTNKKPTVPKKLLLNK
jgi:hypothetical protein